MSTPVWQPGTTYVPGSLVVPTSGAPIITTPLVNPGFETGDLTGWNPSAGTWVTQNASVYQGTWKASGSGSGIIQLDKTDTSPVVPGQVITASAFGNIDNAGTDDVAFTITLEWLDNSATIISASVGNQIGPGPGGSWHQVSVTGTAPPGAAGVFIRLLANAGSHGGSVAFDAVSWNYVSQVAQAGLVYEATQVAPGKSGATEPAWPNVLGVTVTDNQVIWEGIIGSLITWEAEPLLESGATEPTWPTSPGAAILDGSAPSQIDWIAQTGQITDVNCPQSKIVQIAAGKVFAGDNDTIRYSATTNPTDWTSPDNAGYLPFGLQTYGSNPVAAMGLYRSNLYAFNSQGSQMWQVDPDPANITLLDALPIASTYNQAIAPVANDMLFLSSRGIRSIGIADAGVNLEAGDVGMPIDPLMQAAMAAAKANGTMPIATFVPALGQYWVSFQNADNASSTVFVYTIPSVGGQGYWSRYLYPCTIQNFTVLDDVLYIRSNNDILAVDPTTPNDFNNDTAMPSRSAPFPGTVQCPWLDMGNPGVNKMVTGFDFVGNGATPNISFGYDQANFGLYTPSFAIPPDTVPGMIIAMPICAPSLSFRVQYTTSPWQIQAVNLYVQDEREGA